MNDMIQALPIQVPTRFVFLGRSFITLEGMLLNLISEDDLMDVIKPVFMDWLRKQGNNQWEFKKKIHSFTEFLKLPQKLETLKETEQRRHFQFFIYENYKKQSFQLALLGFLATGFGIYTSHQLIWQLSVGMTIVSMIGYFICSFKLKKWMKYMHEKRRG